MTKLMTAVYEAEQAIQKRRTESWEMNAMMVDVSPFLPPAFPVLTSQGLALGADAPDATHSGSARALLRGSSTSKTRPPPPSARPRQSRSSLTSSSPTTATRSSRTAPSTRPSPAPRHRRRHRRLRRPPRSPRPTRTCSGARWSSQTLAGCASFSVARSTASSLQRLGRACRPRISSS